MPIDRRDPERLLIQRQEQAARPKPEPLSRAWPPSEFVPAQSRRNNGSRIAERPQIKPVIDLTQQSPESLPPPEPSPLPRRRAVEDQPQPPATPQPVASQRAAPNSVPSQQWKIPLRAVELTRWQAADTVPPATPKGANQRVIKGRAIKVIVPLDPAEIASIQVRDGVPRVHLRVDVAGHKLALDLAAKSVRKAKATIVEHGAAGVAVILQGKLVGERIDEAGLAAQPKKKPGAEAAT